MKFEFNWPSGYRGDVLVYLKMLTDERTTDRVTGILIAHHGAFGSGELKTNSHVNLIRKL